MTPCALYSYTVAVRSWDHCSTGECS